MKRILTIIFSLALITVPVSLPLVVTGCKNTTKEAKVYYTLKDTWIVASTAYREYAARAVSGKISAEKQAQVDQMWNQFRKDYRAALIASKTKGDAIAPESLTVLKNQLLNLLKTL